MSVIQSLTPKTKQISQEELASSGLCDPDVLSLTVWVLISTVSG